MILRKPYAILIKNFKLIHLIISAFLCYLLYKTYSLVGFFSEYIASPIKLLDPSKVNSLTNILLFIIPFLVIIGSVVIMILMRFKKKPITFYFLMIVSSILSLVYYVFVTSILTKLEINLVDVRTLKLCQDFSQTLLIIQFLTTVVTIVRATGFNIKKFNFTKDLEELDIEETDNEEFEVNVEVDSDKYKRKLRRFQRYARYIFIENRFILLIALFVVIFVLGILIYLNITVFNKIYKVGEMIGTSEFALTVTGSYVTEFDYQGKDEDNYSYIVVPFSVSRLALNPTKLETAKFYLSIGGHNFYHNTKLNNAFSDLGRGYNNEKLPTTEEKYNFIFRIPTNFLKEKMYMIYHDSPKKYKYRIEPSLLDKDMNIKETKLGSSMNLEDSILKKSTFQIESYELSYAFRTSYSFCPSHGDCYESFEYVIPTYEGRNNKVLLKLVGTFEKDRNVTIEDIATFKSFIEKFGRIEYMDQTGVHGVSSMRFVKPQVSKPLNTYYIECPTELTSADYIWISFYIRGKQYKYSIK